MSNLELKLAEEFVIPAASAKAFTVKKGQVLRVIAHEGPQCADIRFFNAHDYNEQAATAFSAAVNSLAGTGGEKRLKKLWSKPGYENLMLEVIHDDGEDHKMSAQCSPLIQEAWDGGPIGKEIGPMLHKGHITCAEQYDILLKPYGLSMKDLDSMGVFNVFFSVRVADDADGNWIINEPSGGKDDYVDFLAHMDLLVASVMCADLGPVNGGSPSAMKHQIYDVVA